MSAFTAKDATSICQGKLVDEGFFKTASGAALEMDSGVFFWVGLNTGTHDDFVRVNPFVGAHDERLMRTVAELDGSKYSKAKLATVTVHLGEIAPHLKQFVFGMGEEAEQASRLAKAVVEYGLPWARNAANNLVELLEERVSQLGGYPQRYAVALALRGDIDNARMFVEDHLKNISKWSNAVATFKTFAERFADRF